jgi:hypothetical protein
MEEYTTSATTRLSRRISSNDPPYWLISRDGSKHVEIFVVERSREESVLPVFSSKQEAQLFAQKKEQVKGGWHARPTGIGELVSVLYGPCRRVGSVALDPPWETLGERTLDLVCLSRGEFVDFLLGRGRSWFEEGHRKRVS